MDRFDIFIYHNGWTSIPLNNYAPYDTIPYLGRDGSMSKALHWVFRKDNEGWFAANPRSETHHNQLQLGPKCMSEYANLISLSRKLCKLNTVELQQILISIELIITNSADEIVFEFSLPLTRLLDSLIKAVAAIHSSMSISIIRLHTRASQPMAPEYHPKPARSSWSN